MSAGHDDSQARHPKHDNNSSRAVTFEKGSSSSSFKSSALRLFSRRILPFGVAVTRPMVLNVGQSSRQRAQLIHRSSSVFHLSNCLPFCSQHNVRVSKYRKALYGFHHTDSPTHSVTAKCCRWLNCYPPYNFLASLTPSNVACSIFRGERQSPI